MPVREGGRFRSEQAARELQKAAALPTPAFIAAALKASAPGRVAVVSSFGAESAVLLDLVAEVDRETPVIFIDTGRHFRETLIYRDALVRRLRLGGLRIIRPDPEEASRLDPTFTRAAWDPDGCCAFRKTAPLERALAEFDVWISGRKQFQADTRAALPLIEQDGPRLKANPLARWSAEDLAEHARRRDLPPHPLVASGYLSIGCAPCTRPVRAGEDVRAGRWAGFEKTECGIHRASEPLRV